MQQRNTILGLFAAATLVVGWVVFVTQKSNLKGICQATGKLIPPDEFVTSSIDLLKLPPQKRYDDIIEIRIYDKRKVNLNRKTDGSPDSEIYVRLKNGDKIDVEKFPRLKAVLNFRRFVEPENYDFDRLFEERPRTCIYMLSPKEHLCSQVDVFTSRKNWTFQKYGRLRGYLDHKNIGIYIDKNGYLRYTISQFLFPIDNCNTDHLFKEKNNDLYGIYRKFRSKGKIGHIYKYSEKKEYKFGDIELILKDALPQILNIGQPLELEFIQSGRGGMSR
jgi:hypothetical protein